MNFNEIFWLYLRLVLCLLCCTVRCDSRIKRNLRRVYDNDLITNLNNEKIKILTLNKKVLNNTIIKQGDFICGKCRSYVNYKKHKNTSHYHKLALNCV